MDMTLSIQKAAFQDRNEDMGVTVPLSAEVANQLRLHHHRSREQQQPPPTTTTTTITDPQLTVLSSLSLSSNLQIHAVESSEQEHDSDYEPSAAQMTSSLVDPLDDWNEVLPVDNVPQERDDDEVEEEEEEGEDNDDEEEEPETQDTANINNNDDSDDDELSLSPPPHMPVVLVELQRLVGYTPSTQEEREDLTHQIQTAMWHGSVHAASHKAGGNPQEDYFNVPQILDAAQHFEERVAELMKSGVALHSTTNATDTTGCNGNESDGNNDGDEKEKETSFIVTTTASVTNSQKYAVIAYPEYLCTPSTMRNNTDDDDDDDETATKEFIPPRRLVVSTAHIWKRLLRSHPIPVVNSLLDHVRNCHRTLLWKHAMHLELQQLATTEERARIRRHQTSALKQWKMVKRQAQLEQLYNVRETLEHRYEMARAKVQDQLDRRDQTVKIELLKRRMQAFDTNTNSDVGGLEALDLNSTILAFPDNAMNGWLGLEGEDNDDYDDQVGPSFVSDGSDDDEHYDGGEESDSSGYDAERDIDEKSQEGVTAAPTTATVTPTLDLDSGVLFTSNNALNPTATTSTTQTFPKRDTKARREALAKKRRRRLEEAAKEAEHQAKLDKAMAEEARMREMMTTTDLRMSQAIAAALEKKLESVDNLLESLQDEAWADEEAQENGKIILPEDEEDFGGETSSSNDNELTLLDQVLAMILGTYPPPAPTNREDPANVLARHTLQLQAEHARIVKEWKAHFGRLPPPLAIEKSEQEEEQTSIKHPPKSKGKSQTELRSSFGIVENEDNDWENADSEDDGGNGGVDGNVVSISSSPGNTQRTAVPAPSSRPPTVGLRPGGRAKK